MVSQKEIEKIHNTLDNLFWEGDFEEANNTLENLELTGEDDDVLITYLTASIPAKTKLPARSRLYEELINRGYTEMDLKGLEY
jgi:hypothetical protein